MTATIEPSALTHPSPTTPEFLWLDLTRKCQLACTHCYNASGPDGTHGTMAREDWLSVLDQAAACGIRHVQLIGGEPTLHPDAAELLDHALTLGLEVEVFTNMVRVTDEWWALFRRAGVTLATSYYSDQAEEHNAMTGRRTHARTRANIEKALRLRIPLRVGIIGDSQERISAAWRDLEDLGVTRIGADYVRAFGRAAHEQMPDPANLCGRCGSGRAAIDPNGEVSPCIMSGWMGVGNVQDTPLAAILSGTAMAQANATIRSATNNRGCYPDDCRPSTTPCYPDIAPCQPDHNPKVPCNPDDYCDPGPLSCEPRDRG